MTMTFVNISNRLPKCLYVKKISTNMGLEFEKGGRKGGYDNL